jgi:putative ABC transport system substrate-binding protein
MIGVSDPVGAGFVASLSRPGGTITGVSNIARDLSAKQVELLREIVPDMKRIGVMVNPNNPGAVVQLQGAKDAVGAFGLELDVVEARLPEEFERGFTRLSEQGAKGVVLLADTTLVEYGGRIAESARNARLATAFQRRENVEAGGLLSYGPSLSDQVRLAASYVDRILKGAKPAELPVEQPAKIELVINLKTAKALGFDVPLILQQRADEVIE